MASLIARSPVPPGQGEFLEEGSILFARDFNGYDYTSSAYGRGQRTDPSGWLTDPVTFLSSNFRTAPEDLFLVDAVTEGIMLQPLAGHEWGSPITEVLVAKNRERTEEWRAEVGIPETYSGVYSREDDEIQDDLYGNQVKFHGMGGDPESELRVDLRPSWIVRVYVPEAPDDQFHTIGLRMPSWTDIPLVWVDGTEYFDNYPAIWLRSRSTTEMTIAIRSGVETVTVREGLGFGWYTVGMAIDRDGVYHYWAKNDLEPFDADDYLGNNFDDIDTPNPSRRYSREINDIMISFYSPTETPYYLADVRYFIDPLPEDPIAETGDDHANATSGATMLGADSVINGQIETPEDHDFFRIDLSETSLVFLAATGDTDVFGVLYDEAGNLVARGDDTATEEIRLLDPELAPGTYFFRVVGYDREMTGSYQLTSKVTPSHLFGVVSWEQSASTATLQFATEAGKSYRLEHSNGLNGWTEVEAGISGTGSPVTRSFSNEIRGFYRVGLE